MSDMLRDNKKTKIKTRKENKLVKYVNVGLQNSYISRFVQRTEKECEYS